MSTDEVTTLALGRLRHGTTTEERIRGIISSRVWRMMIIIIKIIIILYANK